jgi:hypothetical protein
MERFYAGWHNPNIEMGKLAAGRHRKEATSMPW